MSVAALAGVASAVLVLTATAVTLAMVCRRDDRWRAGLVVTGIGLCLLAIALNGIDSFAAYPRGPTSPAAAHP